MADRLFIVLHGLLKTPLGSDLGTKLLKDNLPSNNSSYNTQHENYSYIHAPSRAGTILTMETEYRTPFPISNPLNPFSDYLSEDAKVWTTYLELTKSKGEELVRIWNSDLDTILIFAGLFSAILAAFLIETRKGLQRDNQDATNFLLEEVIRTLRSPQSLTAAKDASEDLGKHYAPSASVLWINGLLFVSLTFSLVGAFGTILAKGWVSQFIPVSAGLPMNDACNRHRRFFGDDQRHLRTVINALPITLHVAFYLFFGGLVTLLFQDDPRIAVVVTALIAATMLLYLGCSMRPILNPQSPFRTPLSSLLPVFPALFLPLILIVDVFGHVYYRPTSRRVSRRKIKRAEVTKMELLCLTVTQLRKQWMATVFRPVSLLMKLVHVSRPPSDELRTEVLVSLLALSRGSQLEGPVCALAGLPMTARLQRLLYDIDLLPALTRSLSDVLSGVGKSETSDVGEAHLILFLSLVQTTYSTLNWTANSLIPVLEPGCILHTGQGYNDNIVELITCIHIHVYVRSGLTLPTSLTDDLPNMLLKCTKPLHRRFLIEAFLALSAIDGGQVIRKLVVDDITRQMILETDFGTILSNMMNSPQRRIQKAGLSSVKALASHRISCFALTRGNIIPVLLDAIPGKDSELQAEAINVFPPLLQHDTQDASDPLNCCDTSDFFPWINQLFELMLKALLKKDFLNVQEAAANTLSAILTKDHLREVFIGLNHIDVLFNMVELGDSNWQISVLRILDGLIVYGDIRAALRQQRLSERMTRALLSATPHVRRHIFAFFANCLRHNELKFLLADEGLDISLLELFKLQHITSEFAEEIFSVLFRISNTPETCQTLLSTDMIYHLLKTITSEPYGTASRNYALRILYNILSCKLNTSVFVDAIRDMDTTKFSVPTSLVNTILCALDTGSCQDVNNVNLPLKILPLCLSYVDLVEALKKSPAINKLLDLLRVGVPEITAKVAIILYDCVHRESLRASIIKPRTVESLLHVILVDGDSNVAQVSYNLLKYCFQTALNSTALLPPTAPSLISRLLDTRRYGVLAALTLIVDMLNSASDLNPPGKDFLTTEDPLLKFITSHVLSKLLQIFGSAKDSATQELSVDVVYHLMNHDYFRWKLFTPLFFDSVCEATMSQHETHRQSALQILLRLLDNKESFVLFSQRSDVVCLVDLLKNSEPQSQWLVLRILAKLARFGMSMMVRRYPRCHA